MSHPFFVGLDLGQLSDSAALMVLQRFAVYDKVDKEPKGIDPIEVLYPGMTSVSVKQHWNGVEFKTVAAKKEPRVKKWHYHLRHIEKFRLGTSYPDIVDYVVGLFASDPVSGGALCVDATGVGRPVVDMFRRAQTEGVILSKNPFSKNLAPGRTKLRAVIRPITIMAGHSVTPDEPGGWRVPKRHLISAVKVLVGSNRILMPKIPLARELEKELGVFKVKQKVTTGNESYEADKPSDHDDLVLALSLCCWVSERQKEFWVSC